MGAVTLAGIQQGLQDIYELNIDHKVDDFLVTSRDIARQLEQRPGSPAVMEKLLVRQDDDAVNMALYLDAGVLRRLGEHGMVRSCGAHNLGDFCLALEGVSHFLYLAWNATHERCVTRLEMELQAEIDKFVVLRRQGEDDARLPSPPRLMEFLFRSAAFHEGLSDGDLRRYQEANRYAAFYCRHLEENYFRSRSRGETLNELRRFYRLSQQRKMQYIGRPH